MQETERIQHCTYENVVLQSVSMLKCYIKTNTKKKIKKINIEAQREEWKGGETTIMEIEGN
jgi:hypothetical protein